MALPVIAGAAAATVPIARAELPDTVSVAIELLGSFRFRERSASNGEGRAGRLTAGSTGREDEPVGSEARCAEPPAILRGALNSARRRYIAQELLQRQQALRVHHPQQSELKVETLFLLVAQFVVRAQHDLQETRQILFA